MWKEIRFALYTIRKNIQSSAELRTSFLMNIVGMAINNVSFIVMWGFFVSAVGSVGGWTVADIIGLQGFVATSLGLVLSGGAGLRFLPRNVVSGTFDQFMLSPKSLLLRVITSDFLVSALGDMVFGIICIVTYCFLISATWVHICLMFFLLFISVLSFFSVSVVVASSSFFFSNGENVSESLFELYLSPALFHGGAFQGALRFCFTFVIPSLIAGSLPVEVLKTLNWNDSFVLFAIAIVWFMFALWFFRFSVKRYESSNSIGLH